MCPSRNVTSIEWQSPGPFWPFRTTPTTLTDQGSIIKIIAEFALFTWSSSLWFWWRWEWLHCFVIINDRVAMNAATHSDFCLRVAISWVVFNTHRKVLGFGNAWLEQVTWNKSGFWYHLVVCTLCFFLLLHVVSNKTQTNILQTIFTSPLKVTFLVGWKCHQKISTESYFADMLPGQTLLRSKHILNLMKFSKMS